MHYDPVIKITDTVPADLICERIGVMPRSIRLARERKMFPASWYREMKAICAEHDLDCPVSAFNFKSADAERGAA